MDRFATLLVLLPAAGLFAVASAQSGLELPRQSNTELLLTDLPAPAPGALTVQRVFPALSAGANDMFVQLVEIPDGSNRLAAVQRSGLIRVFPRVPDPQPGDIETLLDLQGLVCTSQEFGVYSICFDPDYAENGHFYITYTPATGRCTLFNPSDPWRLSRFTNSDPAGADVDPGSEVVLIEEPQFHWFHKGGMIRFGPDGMLYASLGESGAMELAQDTTNLRGTVIRIDVTSPPDPGLDYRIPPDNPFFDGGPAGAATRKEIYAYGFRNPWRFAFDATTGDLLLGDVGEESFEEINLVLPGRNYGWPYFENTICHNAVGCASIQHEPPIAGYAHSGGFDAVSTGTTYHGDSIPGLFGVFLFAEIQGQVYGLRRQQGEWQQFQVHSGVGFMIASMGEDSTGEVYLLQGFAADNGIHVLRPTSNSGVDSFPRRLSDHPALLTAAQGLGHTVAGVYPYEPASQLWSDGTIKERYLAIPGLATINWTPQDAWGFPNGTILIKNFSLPLDDRLPLDTLQRIETRLLYRRSGTWHGFSYEWNEEETDALLLPDSKSRPFTRIDAEGNPYNYAWYYPSRTDCNACHTAAAGHVLGLATPSLNHDFQYPTSGVTANQLASFGYVGLFSSSYPGNPSELPAMPDFRDTSAGLAERARAYLASNCSMCHRPGAPAPTDLDFRWEADDLHAIDVLPTRGDLGIEDPRIVFPGVPQFSVLLSRMESTDPATRMPPLASSKIDDEGVALIRAWIDEMQPPAASRHWQHYE
ncbi:MAG: PQQ-dependent sugar dehydrogenase [Candidatus Sumerlaeia bacterium]|nr:PQQ-dependent sugar dehydrogenase [Candidatus Sumerlaeia bacterium]